MWVIPKATPPRTSPRATCACAAGMFCIRWVGMRLGCRRSSMRSRPANIHARQLKKTSPILSGKSRASVFATTGVAKLTRRIRVISNGASGYFCSCTIHGSIRRRTRPSRLIHWNIQLISSVMKRSVVIVIYFVWHLSPRHRLIGALNWARCWRMRR